MEVKITHLDQATFAIHSPSHSILCDQLAELRWERKKSEYKKSGPDRPTKLIFIVLLRSEFNLSALGSLDVYAQDCKDAPSCDQLATYERLM